jgi:hypothetical protein
MVTHTCHLSYEGGKSRRIVCVRPAFSSKKEEKKGGRKGGSEGER